MSQLSGPATGKIEQPVNNMTAPIAEIPKIRIRPSVLRIDRGLRGRPHPPLWQKSSRNPLLLFCYHNRTGQSSSRLGSCFFLAECCHGSTSLSELCRRVRKRGQAPPLQLCKYGHHTPWCLPKKSGYQLGKTKTRLLKFRKSALVYYRISEMRQRSRRAHR